MTNATDDYRLVGIVYRTWVTPIAALPGKHNTRTGIGGFANRVGIFAYALTPLTVALASRESVLSLITVGTVPALQLFASLVRSHHLRPVHLAHHWLDHCASESIPASAKAVSQLHPPTVHDLWLRGHSVRQLSVHFQLEASHQVDWLRVLP